MPLHDDIQTSGPRNHHAARSDLVRFRLWREGALPRADYQLAASFWTPTSLARAVGLAEHERRMVKRSEPQITGVAYTTRHLYLAVVASVGDYEHVAKLIHCRALVRDDPDYAPHRGKRVSMLMLCNDCPPAVLDFAGRHRVRVIAQCAQFSAEIGTRTGTSFDAPSAPDRAESQKSFSTYGIYWSG